MIEGSDSKKQKCELIKDLFQKGKNGGWEMNVDNPKFQQELTWGAWYTF